MALIVLIAHLRAPRVLRLSRLLLVNAALVKQPVAKREPNVMNFAMTKEEQRAGAKKRKVVPRQSVAAAGMESEPILRKALV